MAYETKLYWTGVFRAWCTGMLKQIDQLPRGERRVALYARLLECHTLLEDMEEELSNDTPLAGHNLPLFEEEEVQTA